MSDTDTTDTARFVGWSKLPGSGTWQKFCSAASEDECWSQIFALPRPRGGDLVVLPAGRTPWDRDRREKTHHTRR